MRFHQLIQVAENKYNRFLASLIVIYFASPFLTDWTIGTLTVFFMFLAAVTLVVYQIQHSKQLLKLYISLVLLAFLLRVLSYSQLTPLDFNRFFEVFAMAILLAFLALSIYLILWELIVAEQVTADTIKGGICVYFLFGFLWTIMYNIVYSFDADAFQSVADTVTRADLTHFSFTTLTTVGYGDIAPLSQAARVLANLEGMVGVMYPTVFIARLVGLYRNQ